MPSTHLARALTSCSAVQPSLCWSAAARSRRRGRGRGRVDRTGDPPAELPGDRISGLNSKRMARRARPPLPLTLLCSCAPNSW
eukprot:scaffold748_cov251-Pinguiococcus_pyrenoidosus.AAC.37